jgi:phosphoglycerol transferase MdoB-like AlkP superfamily enzyme
LYFIFSLLLLIAISASLKKAYPEEIKFLFLLIIAVIIAISLAFFGSSVKTYYEKNKEINANLDSNSQIANMEAQIQYYTEYMDFLSTEILNTRNASRNLQLEIGALIAKQNSANQIPEEIPEVVPPIIIYEEEEEEDD